MAAFAPSGWPIEGRGRALRAAWEDSDATVLAYMDVDLSTDLAALLPLVAPLVSGHSDLAIGTRLARSARVMRAPKRELISRCYNAILRTTLRAGFTDAQCGFKAIRRDRAQALLPYVQDQAWFFDTELLVLAERSGLRIHEVPVDWVDDPHSSVDIAATAVADLRGVVRLMRLPVLARQIGHFAVIGVVSTLAYLGLYLVLRGGLGAFGANAVALGATAIANTAANRRITFGLSERRGMLRHQLLGAVVFGLALLLTSAALAAVHGVDPDPSRWIEVTALLTANAAATAACGSCCFGTGCSDRAGPRRPADQPSQESHSKPPEWVQYGGPRWAYHRPNCSEDQMSITDTAPAKEARLLVVDDEPNILELLSASLRFAGFDVATAANGNDALRVAAAYQPDLLVLDVMMPGLDGFEVVRRLRKDAQHVPVLFLTAKDATEDKVAGLTLGGDDYITKPFSLEEVIARIRAVLRRLANAPAAPPTSTLSFGDIELDDDTHEVWKAGELVALSPTEFKLLRYFMQNPTRVLSKAQILDHVWHYDFGGDANVVESYVSYLRRKIDTTEPRLLHTIRSVGYVLRRPRE